jgi:TP901 family phage tail tape measure protein
MALASSSRIKAGAAYIELSTDNARLIRGLRAAQTTLRTFGQSLKGVGADLLQTSGAMLLPISFAIKQYTEFDDKIRSLQAISGASADEIKGLRNYIRQLGATTAFTSQQVAEGSVELARMGLSSREVKDALKPALSLVRATGEDVYRLGEISSYAATQLRIFNLDSSSFADVCDVMAYAANGSAMNIADLGEAMKIAGPSAFSVGEDIRDTASALMLLANAGVKGSLAGTSLRKIYQSLAAQSGKTKGLTEEQISEGIRGIEQFAALGISVVDKRTGNLRKAADIMFDLAQATKKMKSGEKINFATDVFDLRGSLGALTMLNNSFDFKEIRAGLSDTKGYAERLAVEMEQGVGGMLRLLISQLQDIQLNIGKAFSETFTPLLKKISLVLPVISNFIKSNQKLIAYITLGIGAAFALGLTFFALGAILKVVAFGFGAVLTALSLFVKMILLPATIVKLMIAAFAVLKTVAIFTFTAITSPVFVFVAALTGVIAVLGKFLGLWTAIGNHASRACNKMGLAFADIKGIALDAVAVIKNSLLAGDMERAAAVAATAISLAWAKGTLSIKQAWFSIMTELNNAWEVCVGGLLIAWNNVVNGIIFAFKWMWQKILRIWYPLTATIQEAWAVLVGDLKIAWYEVLFAFKWVQEKFLSYWYPLVANIQDAWIGMTSGLTTAWKTVVKFLGDAWDSFAESVSKVTYDVWYGIWYGIKWVAIEVTKIWNKVVDFFHDAFFAIYKEWLVWSNLIDPEKAGVEIYKAEQNYAQQRKKRYDAREAFEKESKKELSDLKKQWSTQKANAVARSKESRRKREEDYQNALAEIANSKNARKKANQRDLENAMGRVRAISTEVANKREQVRTEVNNAISQTAKESNKRLAEGAARAIALTPDNRKRDAENRRILAGVSALVDRNNDQLFARNDAWKKDVAAKQDEYNKAKAFAAAGIEMLTAVNQLKRWMQESQNFYSSNYKKNDIKAQNEIEKAKKAIQRDPTKGESYVRALIESKKSIANQAKAGFEAALIEAQKDRKIDSNESADLRKFILIHGRAVDMVESYRELLKSSSEGLGASVEIEAGRDALGAWTFAELRKSFTSSPAERTAKATERSANLMYDTNRNVKKVIAKVDQLQPTYGS